MKLLLILLALPTHLYAASCNSESLFSADGKNFTACHDGKKYLSNSCMNGCPLLKEAAASKWQINYKGVGTPGFQFCKHLKGSAFFTKDKLGKQISLCEKNGDFVDLNSLLGALY